jgi:hypothetical protein
MEARLMSNDIVWKSDKERHEAELRIRQEIIKEIRETCKKCPKFDCLKKRKRKGCNKV